MNDFEIIDDFSVNLRRLSSIAYLCDDTNGNALNLAIDEAFCTLISKKQSNFLKRPILKLKCAVYNSDLDIIVAGGLNRHLLVLSLDLELLWSFPFEVSILSMIYHKGSSTIYSATPDGLRRFLITKKMVADETSKLKAVFTLQECGKYLEGNWLYSLTLNDRKDKLAVISFDGSIYLYSSQNCDLISHIPTVFSCTSISIGFSHSPEYPDGEAMIIGTDSGDAQLMSTTSSTVVLGVYKIANDAIIGICGHNSTLTNSCLFATRSGTIGVYNFPMNQLISSVDMDRLNSKFYAVSSHLVSRVLVGHQGGLTLIECRPTVSPITRLTSNVSRLSFCSLSSVFGLSELECRMINLSDASGQDIPLLFAAVSDIASKEIRHCCFRSDAKLLLLTDTHELVHLSAGAPDISFHLSCFLLSLDETPCYLSPTCDLSGSLIVGTSGGRILFLTPKSNNASYDLKLQHRAHYSFVMFSQLCSSSVGFSIGTDASGKSSAALWQYDETINSIPFTLLNRIQTKLSLKQSSISSSNQRDMIAFGSLDGFVGTIHVNLASRRMTFATSICAHHSGAVLATCLVLADGLMISSGEDKTIVIWNSTNLTPLKTVQLTDASSILAIYQDEWLLVSRSQFICKMDWTNMKKNCVTVSDLSAKSDDDITAIFPDLHLPIKDCEVIEACNTQNNEVIHVPKKELLLTALMRTKLRQRTVSDLISISTRKSHASKTSICSTPGPPTSQQPTRTFIRKFLRDAESTLS